MKDIKYFWADVSNDAEIEQLRSRMQAQFEMGWELFYVNAIDTRGTDNRAVTRFYHVLVRDYVPQAQEEISVPVATKRGRPKKEDA